MLISKYSSSIELSESIPCIKHFFQIHYFLHNTSIFHEWFFWSFFSSFLKVTWQSPQPWKILLVSSIIYQKCSWVLDKVHISLPISSFSLNLWFSGCFQGALNGNIGLQWVKNRSSHRRYSIKKVFLSSLFFAVKMALKADLRAYFKRKAIWSEGTVAKKQIANPEMLIPATENLNKQKLKWP